MIYLNERTTYVNPLGFGALRDRYDKQMNVIKKDSLKNAKVGSIALRPTIVID